MDYLRFYVPFKNISLIWRRHHCRSRAAKFRPMLGAQGLCLGRDLYRATPAVTQDLGFSGLIRRTTPFSRLLRHTRGCGGSILTRILTGVSRTVLFTHLLGQVYGYRGPSCILNRIHTESIQNICKYCLIGRIISVFLKYAKKTRLKLPTVYKIQLNLAIHNY
jgi:hypothetical protein